MNEASTNLSTQGRPVTPFDNSQLLKTPNSHILQSLTHNPSRVLETMKQSSPLGGSRPGTSHGSQGLGPGSDSLENSFDRPKSAIACGAAMQAARIERKRTENELQIILNRVSLLRSEEQKGLNKITETKQRARELLMLKKRDEEAYQSKAAAEIRKAEAIQEMAEKAAAEKERRRRKFAENKKLLLDSKIIVAQEHKDMIRRNEEIKRKEKERIEIDRKNAIAVEKERQRLLKLEIEKEREEKIKIMRQEFENRAQEEYVRKLESEQIILELEKEEKELLSRLSKTQALQEKAYSILQRTLAS